MRTHRQRITTEELRAALDELALREAVSLGRGTNPIVRFLAAVPDDD